MQPPLLHPVLELVVSKTIAHMFWITLRSSHSFLVKYLSTDNDFKHMLDFAVYLKVVNDLAERDIKLMSDYSNIITKDEDQKECLLQSVEAHRKKYSNCKKETLLNK